MPGLRDLFGWRGELRPPAELPWEQGQPIYLHILAHLDQERGALAGRGHDLPDDERRYAAPAAGQGSPGEPAQRSAAEQALLESPEQRARAVVSLLRAIARRNRGRDQLALYQRLSLDDLPEYIDLLVDRIGAAGLRPRPFLHEFARTLARQAPDRGPIKLAITLLGLVGDPADRELVFTLGLHQEFALYSSVALSALQDDPLPDLWALAQRVDGLLQEPAWRELAEAALDASGDPALRQRVARALGEAST